MCTKPSQARKAIQPSENVGKEKRKPVRRDPERRRQQNVQAQRKYRDKLRERLDHLEALAASAAQSNSIEATLVANAGSSGALKTHGSSSNITQITAQSLPAYDVSDISVSSSSVATPGECHHLKPRSDEASSSPRIWDTRTYIDPSFLIRDRHDNSLGPYWPTTMDCSCSSPHLQVPTQCPDPFSHSEVQTLGYRPSEMAADPYANNLRIEIICITAALYGLGMHVGVTEDMLCADESTSPFFRSSAELEDGMARAKMIGTVQSIFKTLKPDLRPSSEQITVQHHPYIDILPFPTLRKNLITHQEEIDDDEFFHDMLTGLVCWGGTGIGRKDREVSTGYASTGTPWDVRSWEAKVWFLKKYWSLLGGEDGELVRQSEWWRSIRGDDTLNVEVNS